MADDRETQIQFDALVTRLDCVVELLEAQNRLLEDANNIAHYSHA